MALGGLLIHLGLVNTVEDPGSIEALQTGRFSWAAGSMAGIGCLDGWCLATIMPAGGSAKGYGGLIAGESFLQPSVNIACTTHTIVTPRGLQRSNHLYWARLDIDIYL